MTNSYSQGLDVWDILSDVTSDVLERTLAARDLVTGQHARRMQGLVAAFAAGMGLSENNIYQLRLLARLHDIGKIGIPDSILCKHGPLTLEERMIMQRHSEIGCRLVQGIPGFGRIPDWILKHHERWDGKGYPLGLSGKDIPFECRVLAISDAYEAVTGYRPYRRQLTHGEATRELDRYAGSQFDPSLVGEFLRLSTATCLG
ncbi:MAG: HD-GYP domain-containing protein [Firmicutes bacterium]|nr:HD-GYP domain-containing protein [Bacillota bacterium]